MTGATPAAPCNRECCRSSITLRTPYLAVQGHDVLSCRKIDRSSRRTTWAGWVVIGVGIALVNSGIKGESRNGVARWHLSRDRTIANLSESEWCDGTGHSDNR